MQCIGLSGVVVSLIIQTESLIDHERIRDGYIRMSCFEGFDFFFLLEVLQVES
ncbi:hypothetical protein D3C87_1162650 [compost metagenome]